MSYQCVKLVWFGVFAAAEVSEGNSAECSAADACAPEYSSLIQHSFRDIPEPCDESPAWPEFLGSIATELDLPDKLFTVSGTHLAQGYHDESGKEVNPYGMFDDCYNINLNKKLASSFMSATIPGLTGFFWKCEPNYSDNKNKYWFTIAATSKRNVETLCSPDTNYTKVYDAQHNTWWQDFPFVCDEGPSNACEGKKAFLSKIGVHMGLSEHDGVEMATRSGTHFAQGYRVESADEVYLGSAQSGMSADCLNINQNMKLSTGFFTSVFEPAGVFGFFYKCEHFPENSTNKYWFTLTGTKSQMQKLCSFGLHMESPEKFPMVYDPQHSTWWQDFPFYCI